ncbi:uncharacterized protein PV09_07223 [Verruconis gallopava]|uniref:ADP-ribosylation factor GTPase-activating protein n=1 Tax=Verruconis gallopava TaxID=253628 RepID=A0A0D1XGY6_9PEZI|nr:uncharacterized protein PV09_07223 [Verruconis gallopava]KIW01466.1 hypothetical protein PV09_07223 [Verruconis gallopava]
MGVGSSRVGEGAGSVYMRDQTRFSIAALTVTNSRNRTLLSVAPNEFPASRYVARREAGDETPIEYIQDPESGSSSQPPSFLLRLSNDDDLIFNFTIVIRKTPAPPSATADGSVPPAAIDTTINGLTFLYASTTRELENLITKELHADPNLHKNNPNVTLIGDYSTSGNPSVSFQWSWKWRPPKLAEDRGGGWRNCCSFVDYDQRNHRLNPLAIFTFWVQNTQRVAALNSPKSPSPRLDVSGTAKLRVPSSQSIDSRLSDSDGGVDQKDAPPAQSPGVEPIPEDGLGLVPTMTGTTIATSTVKPLDITCPRPGEDFSLAEDGPLFRATMKAMEQRTGSMRARWKRVLRKAEETYAAQQNANNAVAGLIDALRDASTSSTNVVQPAMDHYFDKIAKEILAYERSNTQNLQRMIIEPIAKLYNVDIKQAESKKRDFEEESKEYYAYVSRYLGQRQDSLKEKKRAETDSKYQKKKRDFELKRFDYSSFMQDLHGGRKDQEVLSNLTRYAETQAQGYLKTAKRIEELLPQLEVLIAGVREADKDYQIQRTEREEKRRALEKSSAFPEPEKVLGISQPALANALRNGVGIGRSGSVHGAGAASAPAMTINVPAATSSEPASALMQPVSSVLSSSPSQASKFRGIRDLEERDHNSLGSDATNGYRGKEGLVWAMSRPGSHADPKGLNKQAWHKYWIVLDQGKLSEYTGWKEKLDLHMEPIDLRVASVREARNADRRFCFEIITPQFTRVYQAQGEDDMRTWINAINNTIQNAVEGKGVAEPVPRDSSGSFNKELASVLTGKSASTSHRSGHSSHKSGVSRHATVGEKPSARIQSVEVSESSQRLLRQLREHDPANSFCADCSTDSRVDWVSINLGVIICIECSGIHRSLGTHVSKVRSLTLDPNSFTSDIVEILMKVGNRVSNAIYEAKMERGQKLMPQANREQRLRFITMKYVERAFVLPISPTLSHFGTPDETLLTSVKKHDIPGVIYALALRADVNAHDRSRNTHVVFLALVSADPVSPASTSPASSPRTSIQSPPPPSGGRKPFAIAELLIQNGAEVPQTLPAIPLSQDAKMYLQQKEDLRMGRKTAPAAPLDEGVGTGGDTVTALPTFQPDDVRKKRISSSGRLIKSPPGSSSGTS